MAAHMETCPFECGWDSGEATTEEEGRAALRAHLTVEHGATPERDEPAAAPDGESDTDRPHVRVLINEEADWDRPAALKLKDGRLVALPDWTVRDAAGLAQMALEDGILIGGEIDASDVDYIQADEGSD